MSPTLEIALLWLAFIATHIGLSSDRMRPRLVGVIGAGPFMLLYSLVALVIFIPLVRNYFTYKHVGPWLWQLPRGPVLEWTLILGMGVAFILLVGGLIRPSPAMMIPGGNEARGVQRITRHPITMAVVVFALLHLLPNGAASDLVFFGGFIVFGLLGARHQDQRKLASGGESFRRFYDETPFLPFTGRETLRGLRELGLVVPALGIMFTIVVRYFHATWMGGVFGS